MHTQFRTTQARRSLWMAGLLALAGCQSPAQSPSAVSDEQQRQADMQRYSNTVQQVLHAESIRANAQQLSGSVDLLMTFNRQNEVVSCEARRSTNPAMQVYPYSLKLGALVKGICWDSVFPMAPATAFDGDERLRVKGTMIFPPPSPNAEQRKALDLQTLDYARGRFFWERTLAGQALDSIGVASFEVKANPQGKVQECWVNLRAVQYRPESFKPDNELRNKLTGLCEQLDLRQMPGFALVDGKVPPIATSVFYSPWKGGPKQP